MSGDEHQFFQDVMDGSDLNCAQSNHFGAGGFASSRQF
jgi:hypothetical protein